MDPGTEVEKHHTLEGYSRRYFRELPEGNSSGTSCLCTSKKRHHLWKYNKKAIEQPLLNKLQDEDELSSLAPKCFLAILKYMGDQRASEKEIWGTGLTDQIFEPPLKYEVLRDEVYCQLIKQLTDNNNAQSEEKGWELMWLMTGCFTPSADLLEEVTLFLQSSTIEISDGCLSRLQKTLRNGERKCPPHQVEVEAVQLKSGGIFHKVYFPNDTDDIFEVDSCTHAGRICGDIATQLNLKTREGFSLFIKMTDRVISVPEREYFFDFIQEMADWIRKTKPSPHGSPIPSSDVQYTYQVFFMKMLWINTEPGEDRNADIIFHYHQELPKLLRGYHKCEMEEAVQLAAYIYRVKYGWDTAKLSSHRFPYILKELIPQDLISTQDVAERNEQVQAAYNRDQSISPEDAKIAFLKLIYNWPTFGSSFFEVKQTTELAWPEIVLIAVNKDGVHVISPDTKEFLATYTFDEIASWCSGNTYFHITLDHKYTGKLLLETSLGYKMHDMLMAYINHERETGGQIIGCFPQSGDITYNT